MPESKTGERSAAARGAPSGQRYWEVDAARGAAIVTMVVYHLLYDLDAFGGYDIGATSGFWRWFADATAGAFLLLVGISLSISYSRVSGRRGLFGKYLRRGLGILAYGMALTAVFLVLGAGVVAFGILHLIGVSIILAYPLLGYRLAPLVAGSLVIAAGLVMMAEGVSWDEPWLLPLGVVPEDLSMPDYRPLLPWFGVVLLGLFAGDALYGGGRRTPKKAPPAARPLAGLGRKSLFVYLIHQPILIAVLAALGVIEPGTL